MKVGNNLFAIQYLGEKNTGLDSEYSEHPKWLDMVIIEYKDKTCIKMKDKEQQLNINDWFLYEEDIVHRKINILEVISNEEFHNRYL